MRKEKKEPTAEQKDACKKLAHWLRHICRIDVPEDAISSRIKDAVALKKFIERHFGVKHPQLGEAITNTIKAVEGK